MRDPYEVLGITPAATDDEVKNAYRALARECYPDDSAAKDIGSDAGAPNTPSR